MPSNWPPLQSQTPSWSLCKIWKGGPSDHPQLQWALLTQFIGYLGLHYSSCVLAGLEPEDSGTAGMPCPPPSVLVLLTLQVFADIREPPTAALLARQPLVSLACSLLPPLIAPQGMSFSLWKRSYLALQMQNLRARTLWFWHTTPPPQKKEW